MRDERLLKQTGAYAAALEARLSRMKGARECDPLGRETLTKEEASEYLYEYNGEFDLGAFEAMFRPEYVLPPTLKRTGRKFFYVSVDSDYTV